MTSGIMAFLHHVAAFALVAAIVYEHTMFHKDLTLAEARKIQRMDIVYGVSAGILVILGSAGAALLSIYPTVRFVSWNKYFAKNQAPQISDPEASRIKLLLRLELLAIVLIIFSAAMMARGVGMMQ